MSASALKASAPKPAADPVTAQARCAFDRLAIAADAAVLIAVSGGGDSTALLHLFENWVQRERPDIRPVAATVDHGLRPESKAEAEAVATACRHLGIEHHVLRWAGPRVHGGIQEQARLARYRLLADLAMAEGAAIVLTGHTADDQAETIAMREARSDGGPGLAGIDPATLYARSVWFVRPLLYERRQALQDWVTARSFGFVDDPSNADDRFERVRMRAKLAVDDAERQRLVAIGRAQSQRRRTLARSAARMIDSRSIWRIGDHGLLFDCRQAGGGCQQELSVAWSGVLCWTGNLPRLPGADQASAAHDFAMGAANGQAFTIAGCRLSKSQGVVRIAAEPRNHRPAGSRSFDNLLVSADVPLANALAGLFGAQPYPASPLTIKGESRADWSQMAGFGLANRD